jgi:hypothetical protein
MCGLCVRSHRTAGQDGLLAGCQGAVGAGRDILGSTPRHRLRWCLPPEPGDPLEMASPASCCGFRSCQARTGRNGVAVLHWRFGPSGAGQRLKPGFWTAVAGRDGRDPKAEVPT